MTRKASLNRLDEDFLAAKSEAIRRLVKTVLRDVVEIGQHLVEAKRACGHGNWLPWLEREFNWTERTAQRFMRVSSLVRKDGIVSDLDLPISSLYLLAKRSTPEEVRTEVFARAKAGEKLLPRTIRTIIEDAKHEPRTVHLEITTPPRGREPPPLTLVDIRDEKLKLALQGLERIEDLVIDFPDICEALDVTRRAIEKHLSKPSHLKLVKE